MVGKLDGPGAIQAAKWRFHAINRVLSLSISRPIEPFDPQALTRASTDTAFPYAIAVIT
jgi:hypothetical protein